MAYIGVFHGKEENSVSEKRKDSKGRILKDGESQRKNGTYDYRYTDCHQKRRCIYAKTLTELRKKEAEIAKDLWDGIDYAAGEITVIELVDRYINLRRNLKSNSLRAYGSAINRIRASAFGQRQIKQIKISDAKAWFLELHDSGLKTNTIEIIQTVVRPAFEMAVDDDMIRKNPFKFKMSDILPNDANVRYALSKEQQQMFLDFLRNYGNGNYYDDVVILLGTGLRVSELYGLTFSDVNLKDRYLEITHQLCRTASKPYFITPPKTKSGIRRIPLTDQVYEAFCRVIQNRNPFKGEFMIDGHTGFLFLDQYGMPKVAMHLENYLRNIQNKHEKETRTAFPRVTPHVLRHTFCTNAQKAGLDVKSLQYLMGHSHASVTLDVYTHTDYSSVLKAFDNIAVNL